jgi:hypothetical protein
MVDCVSEVIAQYQRQLVQLPFLPTSSYGCARLSPDSLVTTFFFTYLFYAKKRAVQFMKDFTTFTHV